MTFGVEKELPFKSRDRRRHLEAVTPPESNAAASQAAVVAERLLDTVDLDVNAAMAAGGFYEANRRLIQIYREANRTLSRVLSEQYREAHELLCREYGQEIGELWV